MYLWWSDGAVHSSQQEGCRLDTAPAFLYGVCMLFVPAWVASGYCLMPEMPPDPYHDMDKTQLTRFYFERQQAQIVAASEFGGS